MDLHITRLKGYCEIQTDSGQVYTGTICLHETSVHVYRNNHEIPRDGEHMEIRIDEKQRLIKRQEI